MELRQEIYNLRQMIDAAIDPETRKELRRELNLLTLRFNCLRRKNSANGITDAY